MVVFLIILVALEAGYAECRLDVIIIINIIAASRQTLLKKKAERHV
jgi:hypothetical protein